ncbi:hypothetical protein K469DRAFT_175223 [Zopfia rhizophila CBS 207.26]|uniref:Uncharacterized protein n=1 Tax=Zopfia rhizophila CBS 207.26 TaxID=1314779 RepID=A0A6A6E2C9_9PEZI|nr:hypothetical protein K469DRAFT_175223 [Zopfia rhizophila CBS 207.26]
MRIAPPSSGRVLTARSLVATVGLARSHLRALAYNGTLEIPVLILLTFLEKHPGGAVFSRHKEAHTIEIPLATFFHHPVIVL